jgi:hypothetical protein
VILDDRASKGRGLFHFGSEPLATPRVAIRAPFGPIMAFSPKLTKLTSSAVKKVKGKSTECFISVHILGRRSTGKFAQLAIFLFLFKVIPRLIGIPAPHRTEAAKMTTKL